MTMTRKPRGQALRILATLCAVLFFLGAALPAGANTKAQIDALKKQQQALSSSKSSLEQQLSGVKNEAATLLNRKLILEEQVEVIRSQLQVTNDMIAAYDQQIADKAVELAEAEAEEARYFALFQDRVKDMERGGDISYWAILFSSSDFSDLIDRINVIGEIMDYDNRMMDVLEAARQAVIAAKAELENLRAEQLEAKQSLEASQAELLKQERALDALLSELKSKEAEYKNKLDELAEDSTDLTKELAAAERKYAAELEAARQQSNQTNSSGATANLTGSGGFIWPLPGYTRVNSPYGNRTHPISGKPSFHGGIDVPAPGGTKLIAAKAGTVVISTYNSSYGNYVAIAHPDGSRTLYAHMKTRAATPGQSVSQGQLIGYVGTTGSSTGNHLHFEVWRGSTSSTRTNPMNFF